MVQRKCLLVSNDDVACELCGRTLLTGERPAFFSEPGHEARLVCELCAPGVRRRDWAPSRVGWGSSGRLTIAEAASRVALHGPGEP